MFSREYCEISKNTFFTEHLQATSSVRSVQWNCEKYMELFISYEMDKIIYVLHC